MKVISNSGPLVALAKIGKIDLLHTLYGTIFVPKAVYEEVVRAGLAHGEADALNIELAFRRKQLQATPETTLSGQVKALQLDRGEKHAIQLALENKADLILLDDMKARQEAKTMGLQVKGTLGVFVDAVRENVLELSEIDIVFETILKRNDIWIADELVLRVREKLKSKFGTGEI